jgi:threonine 3-dehydrogenase
MKAVIKACYGPGVQISQVPIPTVGAADVLIKVKAAGICGSDIPVYDWDEPWTRATVKKGQIIGHEFCGEVVEKGDRADNIAVGNFVVVEGHLNCGICSQCRSGEAHVCPNAKLLGFDHPGAFAEYVCVPDRNVIPISKLPLDLAAILDPLGCAVHAISSVLLVSNTVLVTGCGPIGLLSIMLAKMAGAHRIIATEVSPYRLNLAKKVGADLTINPTNQDVEKTIKGTTKESGVDVFFEMSGSAEALKQGFRVLRGGGQAVLLGLPKKPVSFDFGTEIITKGVTVHGIIGRTFYKNWIQIQKLIDTKINKKATNFRSIVTHHFLIDEFDKAMGLIHSKNCGKVILYMDKETMIQNL